MATTASVNGGGNTLPNIDETGSSAPIDIFNGIVTDIGGNQIPSSGSGDILLAQVPTQTAEVVTRTVDGQAVRFFLRDGVLHMSTSTGVQTGNAARTAFSSALSRTPSLIGTALRTFGGTALTVILTEALFPQSVADGTLSNSPTYLASQFLQEAANSDATGSLVYEQEEVRTQDGYFGGYNYRLYNRHTGVVVAEVRDGQLWTNPNLNDDGTFTLFAPPANLTAEQTNGALGSYDNVAQPQLGNSTQVTNTPTLTVNERPLTLTVGGTSYGPPIPVYEPATTPAPEPSYTGEQLGERIQSFLPRSGLNAPVVFGTSGRDAALSRVSDWNRTYTTPAVALNVTYMDPNTGQQAQTWVAYFGVDPRNISGLISNIDLTDSFNVNDPAQVLTNSGLSEAGLDNRTRALEDAVFASSLPTISPQLGNPQQMLPVFDPANYDPFKTTIVSNNSSNISRNNIDNLDLIVPVDNGRSAFIQGVTRANIVSLLNYWNSTGLLRNGVNLDAVISANGLSDLIEVVNGQAQLKPAQAGTSTNQPLLPPAPDYPLLPPGRFPIPDNLPTTSPDGLNPTPEPWDPARDPWADEPEPDAGGGDDEQPPVNGGNGSGGSGGTPPTSPSASEPDPNFFRNWLNKTAKNWETNVSGGDGSFAQRWSQFMQTVGGTVRTVGTGLAVTNAIGLGGAAVFYGGLTERRTSQTQLTPQNAFDELQKLQQNPDNYITNNYSNGIGGIAIGDLAYNVSGHLLEVNLPNGSVYHFRRVPEDLFNSLKQAQVTQGNNSDTVFVNEIITDRSGNRIPVWVEIRPPYRTEPLRDATFNVDIAQGSEWYSGSARINGSIGPLEGFRPHIDAEGTLFYRYDLPTVTTLRLGLPSPTQGFIFGVRQQDTTIFSRLNVSANAIDINALRVRDLTDPNAFFSDREFMVANGRLYVDIGNRNRVRAYIAGSGTGAEALPDISGASIRARETGFIEIGLGADFLRQVTGENSVSFNNGAGTDSINGYLEFQGYTPDFRGQLGFGNDGRFSSDGTEIRPLVPLFEVDPAIQVSTNRLPDITLDVPYLVDGQGWTSGRQNLGPSTIWRLNVSHASGANIPDANTVRNQTGGVSINLSDGSTGYSVDIGGKRYLVLDGRIEVFDITGASAGDIRNMRYQAGNLVANGNFLIDPATQITAPNLGSAGRIGAFAPNQGPSAAVLNEQGENTRTVRTVDGIDLTVTDFNGRSYARATIGGQTYIFDVTGSDPSKSIFLPGSTNSLAAVNSLGGGGSSPSPSEIITNGARRTLSDGRVAFYYSKGGQDYVLYRSRDGELTIYNLTGYRREAIDQFVDQLALLQGGDGILSDPNLYAYKELARAGHEG